MEIKKILAGLALIFGTDWCTAGQIADAALPVTDTQISTMDMLPGLFAWLDSRTLAITTYGDEKVQFPWTLRKVVAYDVESKAVRNLVPKGFLNCVNDREGLVSVQLGDSQSLFVGNIKTPPPVTRLFQWSGKILEDAQARLTSAGWHPMGCVQPDAEDLVDSNWMFGGKPIRYLEKKDGRLRWDSVYVKEAQPVYLEKGGSKKSLNITNKELAAQIRYLPFADSYQLALGTITRGFSNDRNDPLVVMKSNGTISRTSVPPELIQHLVAGYPTIDARMIPVVNGYLVSSLGKFNVNQGLYLVKGNDIKRVWCIAGQEGNAYFDNCRMEQGLLVSPDGCRVAFDSPSNTVGSLERTVKVLELCSGKK